jgi:Putative Actinobacterial Holin-X, holin superfamily III
MVDQTSVSRSNGTHVHASPLTVVGNIADFGNDIATLAELQVKLTALDAKECVEKATTPLIILGAGGILALGSVPVILIGLADVIATSMKISSGSAQLMVGLIALAIAGVASYFGLKGATSSLDSFRRSREELIRNLSWIRTVLVHSGRNGGKRRV